MRSISERTQTAVVWWALALTLVYGLALGFLLHMVPPPHASFSDAAVADFYTRHHDSVRIGAMICAWTGAFMLPLFAVITIQVARDEAGGKILTVLTAMGGSLMSLFLVLPPLFFGVAAYVPKRSSDEVTALMHQLGMLTLVTTDQFYIFAWVAVAIVCFLPSKAPNSPFPRWFGFYTMWTAFMFEAGAIAFLPRHGAFAWNGLLVFWSPLSLFGAWIGVMSTLLLKALKAQRLAAEGVEEAAASLPPREVSIAAV